jgi:peptidoglycan/xylan/chitin deacetylase (PgdA/CDA1 family)
MTARLVVFTGDLNYSVRANIVAIDDAAGGEVDWLILLHTQLRSTRQILHNQWRNAQRHGWRWIPHTAADVLIKLGAANTPAAARNAPGYATTPEGFSVRPRISLHRVNLHAPAAVELARQFSPDLGLSLAAPILRDPLFSVPRHGTLNLHKGRVPQYRGMPPAFWELWNDESEVGCTVHRVEAALDAGPIVAEQAVPRAAYSTLRGLQLTLDDVGIGLMRDAVLATLDGTVQARPQPPGGRTWRSPTLAQRAALARKVSRQAPALPLDPAPKRLARELVFAAWLGWSRWLWRAAARRRVTILLYHRVSDDARDNLTVGIEQFDRQIALLRRRCDMLSLDEALTLTTPRPSVRPAVCITFDDGYEDNYRHAAPILRRHNVAAAFFVATGIVGTDSPFPHDIRRGNPPIPVMTWSQLRELRHDGFTIGSHSVTHIDCAREPEDVVVRELAQSRDQLYRELGTKRPLFAYPYGGRENMTAERLLLVREAGYAGCLSAYGGVNSIPIDPYDIRRSAVYWAFSDRAVLARCTGLT